MRRTLIVVFALVLTTVLAASVARAQNTSSQEPAAAVPPPVQLHYEVEFGGKTRITDGGRWTKFVQFRDIPKNFTVNYLHFTIEKEGSPWSLEGWGRDATQLDQRYRLVLEKFGRMRTEFRYDGYPNFISRLTVAPYNQTSPGVFIMPDTFQAALQAATDAGVPPLVTDLVVNTPFTDLSTRRQRYGLTTEISLTNHWRVDFGFLREHRTGHRPLGLGSYERVAQPTGGFFRVLGDELPAPLNYRNTGVRAGISYQRKRGFLHFEYTGSWFQNRITALRWDNPFSLTDQQGSLPSGGANRWRFGTGQLDLYPDNSAHTLSVSGRVKLPAESFLSAMAAWSFRRQGDAFLPWTLNTAVVTGVPVGVDPTDAGSLPRASLAGEVNVFNTDLVLGTRKWKSFLLTGRYRVYHYTNETPQLPLPGYVAFGDSFWRAAISQAQPGLPAIPMDEFHEPNSFTRQRTSVEAVWKPTPKFQWKIEPNWVAWNREHRQVNRLNEYGVNTQAIYKPVKWFEARPHYRYHNRKPQIYDPGPFEFSALTSGVPPGGFTSGLRMFDQSRRIHNDAGIVFNVMDKAGWTVSANYRYLSDAYDESFFGLGRFLQGTTGLDVNYAPSEHWGFVAYYNHDNIRYRYRSIAKGGGANTWALDNEWDRNTRDKVDTFGVGFNVSSADQKFNLDSSYGLSFARQSFLTVNPNTVQADAVNDATAHPWPDVENRFHELRFDASYRFRHNITGGVRYLFEPYRLDDFALDNGFGIMQPYVFGLEAPENDARRFLFLDSRYSDTNAHMVDVYLRYTF